IVDRIRRLPHQLNAQGEVDRVRAVRRREDRQPHVDGHAELVVLVRGPVEPGHAVHLVLGVAADEDVVAAFADELVEAAAAEEDVVADHVVEQEWAEIVARGAVLGSLLDPVVALAAHLLFVDLGAEDEVVASAGEDLGDVLDGDDEVAAGTAQNDVDGLRRAAMDDVVAVAALQNIVAAGVRDDVIAGAAEDGVVAVAALEAIVAAIAIDGVVALAADDDV